MNVEPDSIIVLNLIYAIRTLVLVYYPIEIIVLSIKYLSIKYPLKVKGNCLSKEELLFFLL